MRNLKIFKKQEEGNGKITAQHGTNKLLPPDFEFSIRS